LHTVAKRLKRRFERDILKLTRRYGFGGGNAQSMVPGSSGRGVSSEDKAAFCRFLYDLDEIQLGEFIQHIDKKFQFVLTKLGNNSVEINVDALDLAAFRKLNGLVRAYLEQAKSTSKAKPTVASAPQIVRNPNPPLPDANGEQQNHEKEKKIEEDESKNEQNSGVPKNQGEIEKDSSNKRPAKVTEDIPGAKKPKLAPSSSQASSSSSSSSSTVPKLPGAPSQTMTASSEL